MRKGAFQVLGSEGGVACVVRRSGKVHFLAAFPGLRHGLLERFPGGFDVARLQERRREVVMQAVTQARRGVVGKDSDSACIGRRRVGVRFLAVQVVAPPTVPLSAGTE